MPDREIVIKELEESVAFFRDRLHGDRFDKWLRASVDTLVLLKAQEPRLITEEDFEDKTKVDDAGGLPVWVEYRRDDEWGEYWEDTSDEWALVYKQHYRTDESMRYWTSHPTDEQREAVPWN